jgi:hypothetical protein
LRLNRPEKAIAAYEQAIALIIGLSLGHPKETARKWGKVCDLVFGYGGGVGAWKNFAPDDDTSDEQQIKAYQLAWRRQHPRTWAFWYAIEDAAIAAVTVRSFSFGRSSTPV